MYLSNGTNGSTGSLTDYCLSVSSEIDYDEYYYMNLVKCSSAKYKFKYGDSYADAIYIFNKDNSYYKDKHDNKLCVYYTDYPRIYKCKNPRNYSNLKWDKITGGNYVDTKSTIITLTESPTSFTTKKTTKISTTKINKTSTKSKTSSKPTIKSTDRCGEFTDAIYICSKDYCCSKHGYCGSSSSYCNNGCQKQFGKCLL
ncbi:hypothetical protein U3516DRAFT_888422 [Neocallimastix sp. 'constans']